MTKRLRIIGLTGPKTCGKDTAAEGLLRLNEGRQLNLFRRRQMAGPAKALASRAFGYPVEWNDDQELKEKPLETWPFICPRQLTIDVANWYRHKYGGDVWANAFEREALREIEEGSWEHYGVQVMPDLRFPEEPAMMARHQSLIIYIQRDEAEKALAEKQAAGDVMANNVSESHYAHMRAIANAVVDNNGTKEHMWGQLYAIINNAWGHWKFWEDIDEMSRNYQKARIAERIA